MNREYCGKACCGPKKAGFPDFIDCELFCPLKDCLEKPFNMNSFMDNDCFQDEYSYNCDAELQFIKIAFN